MTSDPGIAGLAGVAGEEDSGRDEAVIYVGPTSISLLIGNRGKEDAFEQVVACAEDGIATASVVTSAVTTSAASDLRVFIFFMSLLVSHS
jgi:hypothetical protein